MTGIVIGILAAWAILATVNAILASRRLSEVTLSLASINLVLDKLEKHVQPLATLKATLDKERHDREVMAMINDEEGKVDWKRI